MKNFLITTAAFAQAYVIFPLAAKAAITTGLNGAASNLTNVAPEGTEKDLPTMIGNAINVFLGVLGILFIGLVIYAGILYLTDAGEGKKVAKAKTLLTTAVIGMVLVVAAYAIATFVIDALTQVAGG
jgi:hypothetical protein